MKGTFSPCLFYITVCTTPCYQTGCAPHPLRVGSKVHSFRFEPHHVCSVWTLNTSRFLWSKAGTFFKLKSYDFFISWNYFDFSKSNFVKACIFFLRLYEVCKSFKNASALPAIHAMCVNWVCSQNLLVVISVFSLFLKKCIYSGNLRDANSSVWPFSPFWVHGSEHRRSKAMRLCLFISSSVFQDLFRFPLPPNLVHNLYYV